MFVMLESHTISQFCLEILRGVCESEGLAHCFETNINNRTKIEPIMTDHKNLLDAPLDEFIAYIVTHSILLYKLECPIITTIAAITSGPILSNAIINMPLIDQASSRVGYCILRGLAKDALRKTTDYRTVLTAYFSNPDNRMRCIESMRYHFAEAQNAYKHHIRDIVVRFENMGRKINNLIAYYEKHTEELKDLKTSWAGKPWPLTNVVYIRLEDRIKDIKLGGAKKTTTNIERIMRAASWRYTL